jgi:hypothetical protein
VDTATWQALKPTLVSVVIGLAVGAVATVAVYLATPLRGEELLTVATVL